jgi:hypothetical protein
MIVGRCQRLIAAGIPRARALRAPTARRLLSSQPEAGGGGAAETAMDAAHKVAQTALMGVSLAGLGYIGFATYDIYSRSKKSGKPANIQKSLSEKVLTAAAEPWKQGNVQHGDEVAVEEDPVVVKKVVKIARTQSEKVLTAAAEPWKPGNIQHGEEVKVEEDEVVTKAVVKLQKKFSERVLTGAADSWKK